MIKFSCKYVLSYWIVKEIKLNNKVKNNSGCCIRWSEDQLRSHQEKSLSTARVSHTTRARPSKYNNKKIIVDGITFDSGREANRYKELKLMVAAREIMDLCLQVSFELAPSVVIQGRRKPPLRYFADFTYIDSGKWIVEDCKGRRDTAYIIKRHLMMSLHGIEIRET